MLAKLTIVVMSIFVMSAGQRDRLDTPPPEREGMMQPVVVPFTPPPAARLRVPNRVEVKVKGEIKFVRKLSQLKDGESGWIGFWAFDWRTETVDPDCTIRSKKNDEFRIKIEKKDGQLTVTIPDDMEFDPNVVPC